MPNQYVTPSTSRSGRLRSISRALSSTGRSAFQVIRNNPRSTLAAVHAAANKVASGLKQAQNAYKKKKTAQARKAKNQGKVRTSTHNDMTTHAIGKIKVRSAKPIGRKLGNYRYADNRQGIVGSLPGNQGYGDLFNMCTRQQLIGATSALRNAQERWSVSPFELNPFSATRTPTSLYPGAPSDSDPDRFHLAYATYGLNMLNMQNIPADVEVLWCRAVGNHNYSPQVWFENCAEEERLGQNIPLAAPGRSTATAVAGFTRAFSTYAHPRKYRLFKQKWHILKSYRIVLQPGDAHKISGSLSWNKTFARAQLNTDPAVTFLGGITVVPLMICNGSVVGLAGPAVGSPPVIPDATEVTYGPTKIGYIQDLEYHFKALPLQRFNTARVYEGTVDPDAGVEPFTLTIIDDQDEKADVEDA